MKKQIKWIVLVGLIVLLLVGCSKDTEEKEKETQTKEEAHVNKEAERREETESVDTMIEEVPVMRVYDDAIKKIQIGDYISRIDYFVDEVSGEKGEATYLVSVRFQGNGNFEALSLSEKTTLLKEVMTTVGEEVDGKRLVACQEKGEATCPLDRLILDENGHHYNIRFHPDENGEQFLFDGEKKATE